MVHHASSSSNVWVVEDDQDYASTLGYILNHSEGLSCSHLFSSYESLDEAMASVNPPALPDCVLMDIGLPGISGLEAVRKLRARAAHVPILMLTVKDGSSAIQEALAAGASGYLLKDMPIDMILDAIHQCRKGGVLLPPGIADKVLDLLRADRPNDDYGLTAREMDVIRLMVDGLLHKQIADRLMISPHTVENHLRSIYEKLGVHSGLQVVSKAVKEGLI